MKKIYQSPNSYDTWKLCIKNVLSPYSSTNQTGLHLDHSFRSVTYLGHVVSKIASCEL